MFERFTPRARRVVVLAQEEARGLQHNYIGTEHLLLGLLADPESLAARALEGFGMSLTGARQEVVERVKPGKQSVEGHIPFTPRSKKILELALREALTLGHNYIGTEHVLLGIVREGQGPGAQIIAAHAGDLGTVRTAVIDLIPAQQTGSGPRWLRQPDPGSAGPGRTAELLTTPAADSSLNAAIRLAGTRSVGSHHLLLAALSDPQSAAVRALATLGVDVDRARAALRVVDVTGTNDEPPEEAGRRHMMLKITQDRLVIEATDPTLLELARSAGAALHTPPGEDGEIRGDLPAAVSLGAVWQALRDSLEDIRRRATAQGVAQGAAEGVAGGVAAADATPEAAPGDATEGEREA
jgi:ATP-dependent Clp protease ATP-binding subunit ClpA